MISKIKKIFFPGKKSLTAANFGFVNSGSSQINYGINSSSDAIESYSLLGFIGFCVGIRAEDVAKVPLIIVDKKESAINASKSKFILDNPEEFVNGRQFKETLSMHLDLDGNAFILMDRDNALAETTGKPNKLRILNPALVEIIDEFGKVVRATDSRVGRTVVNYRYSHSAGIVNLNPKNIIHIKTGNPNNLLRGMGIVQRNSSLLEAEQIQNLFEKIFFGKGPNAKLAVFWEDVNQAPIAGKMKEFKDNFRFEYGKSKEPIVFVPPGAKVDSMDIKYNELQMLDRQLQNKENCLMMFRVPRSKAGLQSVYTAKEEESRAWQEVLAVNHTLIEEALTPFVQIIDGNNAYPKFKKDTIIDIEKAIKIAQTLVPLGGMKPNELKPLVGLTFDEYAPNEYILPMNYIPASDINYSISETAQPQNQEAGKNICGCSGKHPQEEKKKAGKYNQQLILRNSKKTKLKIEPQITKSVNKFYKELESVVLDNLPKKSDVGFNFAEVKNAAKKDAKNFFTSAITIGINSANQTMGTDVDSSTKNPQVPKIINTLAEKYASRTIDSRVSELEGIISAWRDANTGVSELEGTIKDYFSNLTGKNGWMATRIARTEASNAMDQAMLLSYKELGVQMFDVIGCEDETTDCNRTGITLEELEDLEFHPNHTGAIVPAN
jgi:HK97 family phage portal protein